MQRRWSRNKKRYHLPGTPSYSNANITFVLGLGFLLKKNLLCSGYTLFVQLKHFEKCQWLIVM